MGKENKITRTFATKPSLWEKAKRKAQREGTTISEKIDQWLRDYTKPVKKIAGTVNMPEDYANFSRIGILNEDGSKSLLGK